jgi:hypothetical protein
MNAIRSALNPVFLLSVALVALATSSAHSAVLANLAGDYQGGTVGDAMTAISDQNGNGTWLYYDAQVNSDVTPTSIPTGSVLTFDDNPDGGSGSTVYNAPSGPDSLPAVTNGQLFSDSPAPAAGYLDVHPGSGVDATLMRWTAGSGETGNLVLTFDLSREGVGDGGIAGDPGSGYDDFSIYRNGTQIYDANNLYIGTNTSGTLTLSGVTMGTTIDLVVSTSNGILGYNLSYLDAEISTPEPSTWALLLMGGVVLTVGWKRRQLALASR